MTSKALVGPLTPVKFGRWWAGTGVVQHHLLPRDTMDPRWTACVNHHVACDCREAQFAEHLAEMRGEAEHQRRQADAILAGHPTWPTYHPVTGELLAPGCGCTGCQLARTLGLRGACDPLAELTQQTQQSRSRG